jgi:phage pi2 protein 07
MRLTLLGTLILGLGISTAQAQWVQQNARFRLGFATVQDISIVNPNVVFTTSRGANGGAGYSDISRTNDGGTTWVSGGINGVPGVVIPSFAGISAVDANNVWVGFFGAQTSTSTEGGGYVFYSRNGGSTWTYQSTAAFAGSAAFINDIAMYDLNNGVVVGDPNGGYFEVYTTSNGGTQWNRVPSASLPAPLATEAGRVGVLATVGSSAWFGTNFGRVYYSTNRGSNWQVASTGLPEVTRLAFEDALNGLALYVDAGTGTITLSRTRDGGQTWASFAPTGPAYASGLAQVPGRPGMFVSTGFTTAAPGSSYTTDYGQTWTRIDQGTPRGIVGFYDAQTGWAGGIVSNSGSFTGGIYRSAGLPTSTRSADLEAQLKVFPTPAAGGQLTVEWPAAFRPEQISLVNSLGQVVLTQAVATAAQTRNRTLNASALAKGVYLLRLTAPDATATRRVVLE